MWDEDGDDYLLNRKEIPDELHSAESGLQRGSISIGMRVSSDG